MNKLIDDFIDHQFFNQLVKMRNDQEIRDSSMATFVGIGFSRDTDVDKATEAAIKQTKDGLNGHSGQLVIVLSTMGYPSQKLIHNICEQFPDSKVIGSSTTGFIVHDNIEMFGMLIIAFATNDIQFSTSSMIHLELGDTRSAGKTLASKTIEGLRNQRRQAFLVFYDSRLGNVDPLINGLQDTLGHIFPIIGAGSSDDFLYRSNFQFFDNHVLEYSAIGCMIGGNTHISVGSRHGWKPVGKPRFVSKARGSSIQTIDDKKAVTLYEDFLNISIERDRTLHNSIISLLYPLGIKVPGNSEYLLRNVHRILPDGSINCRGYIPPGSEVHLMIGNADFCIEAAEEAAKECKYNLIGKKPKLIFIIENMSRLKILNRKASQEIKVIRNIFGNKVPIIGMYTNGEIMPFQTMENQKIPYHQNGNIMVLAIS